MTGICPSCPFAREEIYSMTRFKPVAVLLVSGWMMLPTLGQAADDIASLRAELQALKSDYAARVGALETRIEQLESAPVGPATAEAIPPAQQPVPASGS